MNTLLKKHDILFSWPTIIPPIVLASIAGINALTHNSENHDIIAAYINPNFSVLITQSLLLLFIMWQVVTYKSVADLVSIRHKLVSVQKQLFLMVGIEVFLYFGVYYSSVVFMDNKLFVDGNAQIGILLLFSRFFMTLILAFITIIAYRYGHVMSLLIGVQILNLAYHYGLEIGFLLIKYSKLYDPLYRALHHIYNR